MPGALALSIAVGLELLYRWRGHAYVARQYAHPSGPFLFNLISSPWPHTLAEYLDRADTDWRLFQIAWLALVATLLAAPALEPWTARAHDACRRFGRLCADHPRAFLLGGSALVAALTAGVGWLVLLHFPNSGDEYDYLYQAQTLLAGRLSNPPHPLQQFFATSHVIERDGRVFGVFPPGFPLLIAASALVGLPAWAINPLLSAGLFALTFRVTSRVTGDGAVAAIAAITLPCSSYFLMTGGSYFSHTACAFFVVAAMLMMLRMEKGHAGSAALAGVFAGFAMIVRYYTPALCLLPLTVAIWRERRWRREYVWAIAGAILPIAFLLAYNHALSGNPLVLSKGGVAQYDELWFAPGTWHRGAEFMLAHLWDLIVWTPPALLFAYLVSLRAVPFWSRLGAVGAGFATLVLGLYPYINRGGNQYGPRFYFDGWPLLVIAAVAVLFGATRYEDRPVAARRLVLLFFVSVLAHVPIAAYHMRTRHQDVVERLEVTRAVEHAGLHDALVFVATPVGYERPMPVTDYIRNGLANDADVLYALDLGDDNRALEAFYPNRACYVYRYDPAQRAGSLTPCARR